jgi:hypothetical protein
MISLKMMALVRLSSLSYEKKIREAADDVEGGLWELVEPYSIGHLVLQIWN